LHASSTHRTRAGAVAAFDSGIDMPLAEHESLAARRDCSGGAWRAFTPCLTIVNAVAGWLRILRVRVR
jgi:hypothetical protein